MSDHSDKHDLSRLVKELRRANEELAFQNAEKEKQVGELRYLMENSNLADTMQKYKTMLDQIQKLGKVGGWEFNIDTMVQVWTEEVYAIHEVGPDFNPNVEVGINFYTPSSRPIIASAVQKVMEFGTPYDLDLEIITAKGNLRKVHAIGRGDLEHRRIYGFFQDITERKRIEESLRESEERYRLLVTRMKTGIALHEIILDDAGIPKDYRFLDVNEGFEHLTGLRRQDILGRTILDVLPETEPYWIEKYGQVALTGEPLDYENYAKGLDRYYAVTAYSPKRGQFAVIVSDVTTRRKMEESLRDSELRYRTLFSVDKDALFIIDKTSGDILDANIAACSTYGYTHEEMLRLKSTDMSAEPELTMKAMSDMDSDQVSIPKRYHKTKDGVVFPVEISPSQLTLDGRVVILISIRDITERVRNEQHILQLSFHDELTGLYNRRFYEEELRRLDTARNLPLSFVIGDVNGLKLINDSFGHAKGDELLQTVASAMKKESRADDILVRLSGDEFAVLLPKTTTTEAEQMINRFRGRLAQEYIGLLQVSVAFGCATKKESEVPFTSIFKSAEDAMYRSKLYESQSVQNKTISLIMTSLLENNYREQRHSQRVSELSAGLAKRMGLGDTEIARIRLAGLMHDIGKIGLRESVLNKKGQLTDEERKEMQHHPEIGHRILNSVNDFSEISDSVLQHHERWDGTGYPKGLKGEVILLSARIIAVADAYDAMTSERTYRESRSMQEAMEVLRQCSGTQFDPEVVGPFIDMLESPDPLAGKAVVWKHDDTVKPFFSLETDDRMAILAHQVFARQFERDPKMAGEFDERRMRLMFEDILYNMSYLYAAKCMDDGRIFTDYAVWIYRLLTHLPTRQPRERIRDWMVDHYRILDEVLHESLPPEEASGYGQYLEAAIHVTREEYEHPPLIGRNDRGRYVETRKSFLERLLANDSQGAQAVIDDAMHAGISIDDIYTDIIQEVMVEIGDLWHRNVISVDMEHYCTSTTLAILSGFYSKRSSTPRNGRRILVCSVGRELHEMGGRMVSDLFEFHGWDSIYLGAAASKDAVMTAIRANHPDLIALSVTMPQHLPMCLEIVETIRNAPLDVLIAVGGRAFQSTNELWKRWPIDAYKESARELIEWAERRFAGGKGS